MKLLHSARIGFALSLMLSIFPLDPVLAVVTPVATFDGGLVGYARGDEYAQFAGDLDINYETESRMLNYGLVDVTDETVLSACTFEPNLYGNDVGLHFIDTRENSGWSYGCAKGIPVPNGSGLYNFVLFYGDNQFEVLVPDVALPRLLSTVESIAVSPSAVALGDAVDLVPITISTWSDSVVISSCSAADAVQYRPVNTGPWLNAGFMVSKGVRRGCSLGWKGVPPQTSDFRLLSNSVPTPSKRVSVALPTLLRRFANVQVDGASTLLGNVATFTAQIETQYSDDVWRPSRKGDSYSLQFLSATSGGWVDACSGDIEDDGLVVADAFPSETGAWRFASGGYVSDPVQVEVYEPPAAVPSRVTGLTVIERKSHSVSMAWLTPASNRSPILGYRIEVSDDEGETWAVIPNGWSSETSISVSNLLQGNKYSFRVAAVNSVGRGLPSKVATVILKQGQSVTFVQPRPIAVGGRDVVLVAKTTANGLSVHLSVQPGSRTICAISGTRVRAKKPGSCNVVASQSGSAWYKPAVPVIRTILVKK